MKRSVESRRDEFTRFGKKVYFVALGILLLSIAGLILWLLNPNIELVDPFTCFLLGLGSICFMLIGHIIAADE